MGWANIIYQSLVAYLLIGVSRSEAILGIVPPPLPDAC